MSIPATTGPTWSKRERCDRLATARPSAARRLPPGTGTKRADLQGDFNPVRLVRLDVIAALRLRTTYQAALEILET